MKCSFVRKDEFLVCTRCSFFLKTDVSPEKLHKECIPINIEKQKEYPSILQMAKNLGKSLVEYVGSGLKNVDDKEKERRMSICIECPSYQKEDNRCLECGCALNFKTRMETSSCPVGKW